MFWSKRNPYRVNIEKIIFYEILIVLSKFMFEYALAQKLEWISKIIFRDIEIKGWLIFGWNRTEYKHFSTRTKFLRLLVLTSGYRGYLNPDKIMAEFNMY